MVEKIILGTVQFGLNYGINNQNNKPTREKVFEILDYASKKGINLLDTADAYGNAMDLIGEYHQSTTENKFDIITKFKVSNDSNNDIEPVVQNALDRLNVDYLLGYLFHSFEDYHQNGKLLDQLTAIKSNGLVKKIGVSIYTNEEFEVVLRNNDVDIVQLPYNLLDNESLRGSLIKRAKAKGITVHTRSVFLQGLFFKNPNKFPSTLEQLVSKVSKLHKITTKYSYSMVELALNYAISNEDIDSVLIGVDSLEQLKKNLKAVTKGEMPKDLMNCINTIVTEDTSMLNPSNWS